MVDICVAFRQSPLAVLTLIIGMGVGGCKKAASVAPDTERNTSTETSRQNPTDNHRAAPQTAGPGPHAPAHAPIDCPLRKQGIDPSHMRPFADVEKYIAFLDRADRASWQKPDAVVAALDLSGAETVFDLGAGSGYFSFRFSAALPLGRVIAADTEPEMVRHLHHRVMQTGIDNVEAKLITKSDPGVTPDADLVFVCDVLHHVADRGAWLSKLVSEMKVGARLALIEFKEGSLPEGPPEAAKIPRDALVASVTKAGLSLVAEHAALLPYQVFLVFEKP